MFHQRPWHVPGVLAAVIAMLLGSISGFVAMADSASAEEPAGPTVTLSQSTGLVNQRLKVSWSGFVDNRYAVTIVQCRGVPSSTTCDGVGSLFEGHRALYGGNGASGEAWVQVRPKEDRPELGCAAETACVVAAIVRPDRNTSTPGNFVPANVEPVSATANIPTPADFDFAVEAGQVAWAPVEFAPGASLCGAQTTALSVAGNAEHATAGRSWQGGLCRVENPLTMSVGSMTSPEGRDTFRAGDVDGVITTQPLGGPIDESLGQGDDGDPGRKPGEVAYAPLTNGAIVVATNLEINDANLNPVRLPPLNLTPRLVAKLLTHAYGTNVKHKSGSVAMKEVPGFPPRYEHYDSLFEDPEFLAANPGYPAVPVTFDLHTILVRGAYDDTIHELTRWLVSDEATRAWLSGTVDENGIACPDAWRIPALEYPIGLISNRIQDLAWAYRPISAYSGIVDQLAQAQGSETYIGGDGLPTRYKPDDPGDRRVIAITSLEAAERMQLPVARLRNAAGQFVAPTRESIAAGVAAATAGPDGVTLTNNFATQDPSAYPLTKTDVVAFPTREVTKEKAAAIDKYLAYAAGPGQVPSLLPGQLPPGYAPLNDQQKQQIVNARDAIRKAADTPPTSSPPPTTTSGGTTSSASSSASGSGSSGTGTGFSTDGSSDGSLGSVDDGTGFGSDTSTASGGSAGTPPPGGSSPSPAAPNTEPVASAASNDGPSLPGAVADTVRQALKGDASAILLVVIMFAAVGAAVAAPILLSLGWQRRTGQWPPPVAAVIRTIRRIRPTGAA
ncbi:hypothetical protein [Yinghuangia sp. YIM S10712]|uniref:hypothetical protein n=1 Tax=Yinghuangia sp. YIM S10712 TaxID=3436930 RepID=UPI003F535BC7